MLILISTCGLAAAALCLPMMFRETEQRRLDAVRRMHTRLEAVNCCMDPVDLYASQMTIGRWERRCDICLAGLTPRTKDSPISKVHARLWWDGLSYRIAPIPSRRPNGAVVLPKVWVDMVPVTDPKNGMAVAYEQRITLSNARFDFVLVDTSGEF